MSLEFFFRNFYWNFQAGQEKFVDCSVGQQVDICTELWFVIENSLFGGKSEFSYIAIISVIIWKSKTPLCLLSKSESITILLFIWIDTTTA